MKIQTLAVGELMTNCYILCDEQAKVCAVVDPGGEAERIAAAVEKTGCALQYILLTHGHYDHIIGAAELCQKYRPTVCASEKELPVIEEPSYNLSKNHGITVDPFTVDKPLQDGETFMLGETEIRFLLTPGHTMGSGCYIADDCIFSGDTLFCASVGRTDFPTSSMRDMMQSVDRLKNLEGDYRVYPGHDIFTTLDRERKHNPFMQ